jgi:predicted TIM-barrel fold metal-dependent hydrolase
MNQFERRNKMKIDINSHICPIKYKEALYNASEASSKSFQLKLIEGCPTLFDMEARFRILDKYDCTQVLTLITPPIEDVAGPKAAAELARIANDSMAELVYKYPDAFATAVASLPLNDMEATLREVDRAITELKFRGIQIFTSIQGKPLDSPEFFPLYEKMVGYNLPIWIHPFRTSSISDYPVETESKHKIWSTFGWPYETSAAMTRLIFGGVLERYPTLKFITHHCGGMVPFFAERIRSGYDLIEMRMPGQPKLGLTKCPTEYYRLFYNDTAIAGSSPALMCAYDFFGPEHILFGTDMPMDSQTGFRLVRDIISSIENMGISDAHKRQIFEENARKLLRLPI